MKRTTKRIAYNKVTTASIATTANNITVSDATIDEVKAQMLTA